MGNPIPPWHLWGQTNTVELRSIAGGDFQNSQQLARVEYGRPDTFNFLFWAQLTQGSAAGAGLCDIFFDLIIGLGRSAIALPAFEHFQFDLSTETGGQVRVSTEVPGVRSTVDTKENIIRQFPAQSINCVARVVLTHTGSFVNVNVGAQFAPVVHFRPEWFEQRFPGEETEGH